MFKSRFSTSRVISENPFTSTKFVGIFVGISEEAPKATPNVPTQGKSMPLNDTKVRALYSKAQKGEKVGKEADGGGLILLNGKYWRLL